jgi:nitrogen fixation/metabolism regulation signal transduction histidine kinase
MSKISVKIAFPMILAAVFVTVILVSVDYERLSIASYITISLLFIFVFFFGFNTGQSFSVPIKKILNRAIDLNKGDLKTRVYLETKDELSELARAFNQIAEKLEESKCLEEQTEKSVDMKVRAKTKSLEETITALEQKVKNRTIELERANEALKKYQLEPKPKPIEDNEIKDEKS